MRREVLVDNVKQLQLLDDIILNPHSFAKVDEKERPEGIDVGGEDMSHVTLLGYLVEVVPIKVMEFIHEVNAVLNQVKHLGHGEGVVFIFNWRERERERERG